MITQFFRIFGLFTLALFAILSSCAPAIAQRPTFSDFFQSQSPTTSPNQTSFIPPGQLSPPPNVFQQTGVPQGQVVPPVTFAPNSSTIIPNGNFTAPTADPFQSNQSFPVFPRADVTPPPEIFPPAFNNQPGQFANPQFNQPQLGQPVGPSGFSYEGTNSNWQPSSGWEWPGQAWDYCQNTVVPKILERPRARTTYIPGSGSSANDLSINDLEIATTFMIQDFLGSNQPLRLTPLFIFHWWGGPNTILNPGFDLPARAYTAALAMDHLTNPANQFGFETNFTIGYYGDFQNTASYSLRPSGKLLGWMRVNPYSIGKFGIEYINRVDIKLLPSFGMYLTPNPDLKLDIAFPRTKLSMRIPNIGSREAWVYFGTEYGGGSWAVQRIGGINDQADINDIRAFYGIEWMGPRRATGFLDMGYVFDREIVYRSNTLNSLELKDAFMLRFGFAF